MICWEQTGEPVGYTHILPAETPVQAGHPVMQKRPLSPSDLLLPDQGSNLESSDPESDVLPIPPSGSEKLRLQI